MRALLWTVLLGDVCFAQSVTVRVINDNDKRPVPKQAVMVQFFYENPKGISAPTYLTTDDTGETRFTILEPRPKQVSVGVTLTSERWRCACWLKVEPTRMLQKGALMKPPGNLARPSRTPSDAKPGEIVFVARPYTLLEKLLDPLMRE